MNAHRTLGLLLALGAACASAPPKKDVVWPDPPEKARIRFAFAFFGNDSLDDSGWTKFKRGLLGGSNAVVFQQPMGLALSVDGQRLYVADFGAPGLFVADFKEKKVAPFGGEAGVAQPFNVAVDADDNVYVSDSGAKAVVAMDRNGGKLWSATKDLERPTGLALDRQRKILYVVDSGSQSSQNHRVFAYDLKGNRLREVGNGKGTEDTQFHFPVYAAVDRDGKLYVGDTMNFRIQIFDADGTFLGKYGEHGDVPGTFARIKGIDFDGLSNTYVVDGQHSVVQIFNKDWDPLIYFGGMAPLLEYFDLPSCIAVDRKINRIYVCNEHNARINAYDLVNTTAQDSIRPRSEPPEGSAEGAPQGAR